MTDNEIIKALECCIIHKCEKCPAKAMFCSESVPMAFAIPLINRQKAEIEFLKQDALTPVVTKIGGEREQDEVFWSHVDRYCKVLGLEFPDEDYDRMDG